MVFTTNVIITIVMKTQETMVDVGNRGWFIITYKVPSSPSTARVTVWKRTKELGALALQQSVYILPNLDELRESVYQLKEQIQQFGGECKVLEMTTLEEAQVKEIIGEFNHLRNQEYEELLEECDAFFQEIERETKAGKFYFAEVEEIEKRLQGLKEWFGTITRRDFFRAELGEKVSETLKECEDKLGIFSQEVFSREDAAPKDSKIDISRLKLKEKGGYTTRKMQKSYPKDQLIARLKEIVSGLESGTLDVGNVPIEALPELATLGLRYKARRGAKSLEIEIDWQDSGGKKSL